MRLTTFNNIAFVSVLFFLVSACGSNPVKTNGDALYVDPDPAAYAVHPSAEKRDQFLVELDRQIMKEPENPYFIAVRAYQYCLDGQVLECDQSFIRALNIKSVSNEDIRHVLWSKGWSMFILQRYQQAIDDWKEAERLHGGKPYWAAYTLSIAYWRAGDKMQAVHYFDLAVKSNKVWGNDAERARLTAHWKAAEKNAMQELAAYWKAAGNSQR